MQKEPITRAVLLSAGRGKRLQPYTDAIPKPLLPVNGRPTLDLYFDSLAASGVTETILVVHYLAEQIEQYASNIEARYGIRCSTVKQPALDGTAAALEAVLTESKSKPLLQDFVKKPFLLIATDYLIPDSFIPDLLSFHQSIKEDIAISLKTVPEAELSSRSSIRFVASEANTTGTGLIEEIIEKPAPGKAPSPFSTNLAYVLPAEVLTFLADVKTSPRGEREVQTAINAYLAAQGCARGLIQPAPDEWTPALLNS